MKWLHVLIVDSTCNHQCSWNAPLSVVSQPCADKIMLHVVYNIFQSTRYEWTCIIVGFFMQVLPFDDNLCVREPCLNYEECLTVLKFGNASGFISSDTVLFRPIYPVTTFACRCPKGFTGQLFDSEHGRIKLQQNICL